METTNIPRFDLIDLRLFVMVAESNSFTKGAEKVFLSVAAAQPAYQES